MGARLHRLEKRAPSTAKIRSTGGGRAGGLREGPHDHENGVPDQEEEEEEEEEEDSALRVVCADP
eukprot:4359923-Pyramimonas_sp.AAC.1